MKYRCLGILEKIKKYFSLHSIKTKILYSMLAISTCMIVVYMVIVIPYSYENMLEASINSSLQDISSAQNNTDNLVSIVEDFYIILATDETIQETLSSSGEGELSADEILLRSEINDIIGTFSRINAVLLCDMQGNVYDSGVNIISKEMASAYEPGWQTTHEAPYYISVPGRYTQPNVISYTRFIYNYRTGVKIGTISLFVDEEYIKTTYSSDETENKLFFLLSCQDQVISSNNNDYLYQEAPVHIQDMPQEEGFLTTEDSYYIYKAYPQLQCYFVEEIPKNTIENIINEMRFFMIAIGISLILITAVASVLISRRLTRDISRLSKATKQVKNGDWDVYIDCGTEDEIGKLTQNFNSMLTEIKDTTNRLVNEQKTKREYQFALLNQQINPHFLYNTLDNICALAELGLSSEVTELVSNLSIFYRGVLSKGSLIISLERELNIAISYLKIMQTRYHDTFSFETDIDAKIMQISIPKLTLQPVLENAIYHGFEAHEPGGMILITAKAWENDVIVEIQDNGGGMTAEVLEGILKTNAETDKNSFALRNVHDRIQLYYGSKYGIQVESAVNVGTKIRILLPYQLWKETLNVDSVDCG